MRAEGQVSMQRKIEESDFANAQDMFGGGSGGASDGDGKFESWKLTEGSKQELYEDFAMHAAAKITTFKDQFLYLALLRKLIGETTKTLDKDKIKELMLVLTKGRTDFSVIDLMRSLLRDADRSKATTPLPAPSLKTTRQHTPWRFRPAKKKLIA